MLTFRMKEKNALDETRSIRFNTKPIFFAPGTNHTYLTFGDYIEDIDLIKVEYKFKKNIHPRSWGVITPRIYVESITIESLEQRSLSKLCPHHALPVTDQEALLFNQIKSCQYINFQ